MKLLLTGAFHYNKEQLNTLKETAGEIIYIKEERLPLTIEVSDIETVVCNNLFLYNDIQKFTNLKFIQLTSAGYDKIPLEYIKSQNILIENAKGVYSAPMAEWVILMILQIYKKSRTFYSLQNNHQWIKQHDVLELSGKTAVIVGLGNVGKEVAKRLNAFNIHIIGTDITYVHSETIHEFYPMEEVDMALEKADILILTLPLTKETYHFINEDRINRLKNNCLLVNVSRGSVIDESSLVKALQNEKFIGAALDVFEEEPLPTDSPLWEMDNVIITPHNSYESDNVRERLYELIYSNLLNYIQNKKHINVNQSKRRYKYCIVTTMSSSIENWIKPFFKLYYDNNFDITIVCNMTEEYINYMHNEYPNIKTVNISIPRGIHFLKSIKALYHLYLLFVREDYDLVQYSTPNASFYSAIASYLAKIKVRLYCQWGMVFVTMKGWKRFLFQLIERTTCLLSTQIQPDSYGNLMYCRKNRFYSIRKSHVIWNGSAKGVDLNKYDINKKTIYQREILNRFKIDDGYIILGFVGRLGMEKGCNELFQAFKILERKHYKVKLLFVGPLEKENTIKPSLLRWFYQNDNIIKTDRVTDVEKYMAAMDIFILPSYREGFGMSVVEAQAMEIPVIVTDIPGPVNGMIPNVTGLTIPVRDVKALVYATEELINDELKRKLFGQLGREFVKSHFDHEIFAKKLIRNRLNLMKGCKKL
ncbi:phosphoglycerate dehydrogenase-like enzyme [Mobilisporobacter senegalensis]|uniref:Phosphoglycerate dehydrogenase-like enzyme n=1 Tax=Mobilisporobacter senegalensis TaxID=1329262 RepID=A0A3N1XWD1_9FIRM|nr:NAD(P)-dependent oxidoreductase [Mobilisporobacter senegalensis]ROR29247.1 phosphoglycerate dehydrogenase-like enzyme [Mobilisporobacter senegalensis]